MSIVRKIQRKREKQTNKDLNKNIEEKMNMFDRLPDECLTCEEAFDKRDREKVSTWRVVINEDRVRLYCPPCWSTAERVVKEYMEHLKEEEENV